MGKCIWNAIACDEIRDEHGTSTYPSDMQLFTIETLWNVIICTHEFVYIWSVSWFVGGKQWSTILLDANEDVGKLCTMCLPLSHSLL